MSHKSQRTGKWGMPKSAMHHLFYCCNYLLVIRVVLLINVRFIGDGKCTLVHLQHQIRLYSNSIRWGNLQAPFSHNQPCVA